MTLVQEDFRVTHDDVYECWFVIGSDSNLWLRFKELTRRLGYINETNAYTLVDDAWKVKWHDLKHTLSGWPDEVESHSPHYPATMTWSEETLFVSEPGMYMLCARTHKRAAKTFLNFIYHTVLPTIRKSSTYTNTVVGPDGNIEQLNDLIATLKETKKHLRQSLTANAHKDAKLSQLLNDNNKLMHRLMIYRPNLAVMSTRPNINPEVRVYRSRVTANRYRILRAQRRNILNSLKRIDLDEYELVLRRENVPNAINVFNLVKESLPKGEYIAKNNDIITEHDIVQLFEKYLHNVPVTEV